MELYLENGDGYAEVVRTDGVLEVRYATKMYPGYVEQVEDDFRSPEEAAARAIEILFPALKVEVRQP